MVGFQGSLNGIHIRGGIKQYKLMMICSDWVGNTMTWVGNTMTWVGWLVYLGFFFTC